LISPATGIPAGPEWKQFLHLGEELVRQPTAADQCRVMIATLAQLTRSKPDVWLVQPYYPLPGESYPKILPSNDAPALVRRAFDTRQPCCPDGSAFSSACSCAGSGPRQVAFPVITQGFMLAVLSLERGPEQEPFTAEDLDYLEGLAAHAAMALQISRQVTIKNWRNEQLSLVRSVSSQISNLLDLDELCERVTRLIQRTFDYYYVAIFTVDAPGDGPRFRACASEADFHGITPQFPVAPGEGIVGFVAESGSELLAADVRKEPRYRPVDLLPLTRSELTLPLKVEDRVLGVLDIQSDKIDAFHEIDNLVLRSLADNIALAVEGARLYSTVQRRADQISAVLEVSHALSSILDANELLEEVVQVIHRRFGYPYVHLFTVHPGRQLIIYRAGSGERSRAYDALDMTYDLDAPQGIIPWVARNGQTIMANDVTREEHYLPTDQAPYETGSELTIPLMVKDEVVGVLDIQSSHPNAFDENDRSLLEALSSGVAVSMRNATLYRSEVWRRQVAESFRDVAEMLPANHDPETLLERVLVSLEHNLPCDASAIWLLEEDGKGKPRLRLAAARGVTPQQLNRARQRSGSVRSWLEAALKNPNPNIRTPNDPYGPIGAALDFPPDYSSIVSPLRAGDKALGLITLAHHTRGRYGSEARDMTATFASYAAVALQNARLYHDSQEQAWISTLLLQVAEANQSVDTLDEMLENTIQLVPLLVGVKKAAIFLWEEAEDAFRLSANCGMEELQKDKIFPIRDVPALASLIATRSPVYLRNAAKELNLPEADLPQNGTLLLLPLLARNEIQGALLVIHQDGGRGSKNAPGLNDRTLAILQGVAHQTATAVENIRLVEARQEEAYVTAVLLQVAQAVVTLNNLGDILDTITHLMPILVGIDACVIYLWDKDNQVFSPSQAFAGLHQRERDILARSYAPGEFGLLDEVQRTDTHILSPLNDPDLPPTEWPGLPCLPPGSLPTPGMASIGSWLIGVPLSVKGEVYGVMLAKEASTLAVFRERRLEIISGIAQEVSLAIQNDQLQQDMVLRERMEREVQLAREIQRTFLPDHLPQLPGWEMDASWQTARTVGGDFYDIFRIDESHMGIVIADVADKGMPAALYMTVTRTLIRASLKVASTPARVLEQVNNLLVPDAQNGMFVTAVFAILDIHSGELTYANAGHNLPLLVRGSDGSVTRLIKGGMALGVMENTPLHDDTIIIQPGDCLVLYTDGVTETFSPEEESFGEPRLEEVLSRAASRSPKELLASVDHALKVFRATQPLSDDITMIAVYRKME
jgi:serine phosphatase RsbU (regulator of sigma subunit)/putative methionine-R-sulfoxide reductase with GAF domain